MKILRLSVSYLPPSLFYILYCLTIAAAVTFYALLAYALHQRRTHYHRRQPRH